jgi:polygalacturonase
MKTVNVADFGAIADGKTCCLEAFRRAFKAARGDGPIDVPPGRYSVGGTLDLQGKRLKSP